MKPDSELQQLAITDRNPVQEGRYQELLQQNNIAHTVEGGKANVQGFGTGGNLASVDAFNAATGQGGTGVPGEALSFNQPTINLPQLYEGLYAKSGIKDAEAGLTAKTQAYNDTVSQIKDNPYLSEGTMTGRIKKVDEKFNADAANIKNDIAMKKADIETQMNLQTKQFDINSQQARQAFDQFQSLLSSGALDNASGTDIANITRSTGLSSSMIQSAIGVSKAKNAPKEQKLNTQVIQFDDGDNTGFAVINADTGQVINKQIVAASKPSAIEQKAITNGGKGGSGGSTAVATTKQIAADKAAAPQKATQDARNKMTLGTMMAIYQQYGMTKQKIYDIYKANTPYKQNTGTIDNDTKRYGVK